MLVDATAASSTSLPLKLLRAISALFLLRQVSAFFLLRQAHTKAEMQSSARYGCDQVIPSKLNSFCKQSFQARSTHDLSKLHADCEWRPAPESALYSLYSNEADHMEAKVTNASKITISRCTTKLPEDLFFVADRIGMISSSSNNWHAYEWSSVCGTDALIANSSSVHIVTAFTGALNAEDMIIPYPPLEMHHLHVQQSDVADQLYFQSHTETQCDEHHGGVGCLLWSFPSGFGIPLTGALNTYAEMVDARRPGAPNLMFVAEVAVILAIDDDVHRYPVSFMPVTNPYRAQNLETYRTDTFLHAKEKETLFWYSYRSRTAGVLGSLFFHSHWEWTHQCHLFMAHPKQLGLSSPRLRPSKPWEEVDLAGVGLTIQGVNKTLFDHLDLSRTDPNAPRLLASFSPTWEFVNKSYCEGWYPRQNMELEGFRIEKGMDLTLACFHRPLAIEYAQPGVMAMHNVFGGYLIRDDLQVSYDYAKGSTDPSWTWYSLLGGHSVDTVFSKGGGPFGLEATSL